ncbi:LAMI_0H11474g1_1 [Lachancea mirantina]|uniref:LAMI_0H11474g1_1 n=1 Tax=Lachancea mirantina TaxID=1230905 RepID=A0A1G4KHG9_9SACH|nr:LAMI_0H11474g1_1 [Lachancea mirantina]
MEPLGIAFSSEVNKAVAASVQSQQALLVYCSGGDDSWLNSWFTKDLGLKVKDRCVALKLSQNSQEFSYFKAIIPNIAAPSVCCIRNGQVQVVLDEKSDASKCSQELTDYLMPQESNVTSAVGTRKISKDVESYQKDLMEQRRKEREERNRIRKLVEADRKELKSRERCLKAEASGHKEPKDNYIKNLGSKANKCALLFRLFDGNSISHEFPSNLTLKEVRQWVALNRTDGNTPYVFHRAIPRSTFQKSQESQNLSDLNLTPRSALILKPLDTEDLNPRIMNAQDPGLLGRMYNSVSNWWATPAKETQPASEGNAKASQSEDATSEPSSKYVSPATSPFLSHRLGRNPSELSLPSRPVSPNVYKFVNSGDKAEEDRDETFNGNNVSLEDKKKD